MKKKYRRLFHEHDIHDFCKVVMEKVVTGYDHSPKYLLGPLESDGSRELIDVTTICGEPIYSGKTIEVHNP